MKKSKRISLLFIILIFCSCNLGTKEIKTYYENGSLNNVKYFQNENDTLNYYVKYFHENGKVKCEGQKLNGNKNGKWKYYNNKQYIESIEKFCDGLLCDTQTFFFPDGKIDRYKILDQPIPCFCDTQLHYGFIQIAYWRNGKLREVNHTKNCLFDGKTQLYDSITGILSKEFFEIKGKKHGLFKMFYVDSSVMEGYYKDGEPIGKWKTRKGDKLISEINYD